MGEKKDKVVGEIRPGRDLTVEEAQKIHRKGGKVIIGRGAVGIRYGEKNKKEN